MDATALPAPTDHLAPAPLPDLPAPAPGPAPPAAPSGLASLYGWVFLVGLAILIAVIDPIVLDLQHRPEISLLIAGLGALLVIAGVVRAQGRLRWIGAVILWGGIAAGLATQLTPLGVPANLIWAPRAALFCVAAVGWALLMAPPPYLARGVIAVAVPTFLALGILWLTAPVVPRAARVHWLAADARGTLYATDNDAGVVWVFDSNGGIRGKLWPRRARGPGTPGPGVQSAGVSSELNPPIPGPTPTPGGPQPGEFPFCGIAVDPQNNLYMVDILLRQVLQFDQDGQLRAQWPLPDTYALVGGCIAADAGHVYVAGGEKTIHVYDHTGGGYTKWQLASFPAGISVGPGNRVVVLHDRTVEILAAPDGHHVAEWPLPEASALEQPYQAVLARANGEVWVTDLLASQILRFAASGAALPPFSGPGSQPGQLSTPGAFAEDAAGRVWVSDAAYRVVQRFRPDGHADAVWLAPEDEADLR